MSDMDWREIEIGAEVDVAQIMAQIRKRIAEKQKAGIYTEEGIAEIAEAKILQFAEDAEIDSALLERLLSPDHSWNINPGYVISTHRTGFQAKLIVYAKRLVRPFIRLYSDHLFSRQAQINQYFVHLLHNLVRELTRLQINHSNVVYRIDRLEREKDLTEKRLKALEQMVEFKRSDAD